MRKFTSFFFFVLFFLALHAQTFTISGYITDKKSKETLIGVQIANLKQKVGTNSNAYGFYTLTMKKDSVQLILRFLGYTPITLDFYLDKNITYNIELEDAGTDIAPVEVFAEKQNNKASSDSRVGVVELPVQQVKELPSLLGEKDVFKVIQLLPGTQKGSEGNSGLYVRGGGPDQNLIILDDANVYNAFHLFGFFSVFNGDALKSIELIKGGFPARYGGRLSSVLDMRLKDGDKQKLHGEGGVGIISSRLVLEGPLKKDKSSFLISARRTYLDLLKHTIIFDGSKINYYFYDINAKFNYTLNDKNRLFLSGYFGRDVYNNTYNFSPVTNTKSLTTWGNKTSTLRWNRVLTPKAFANLSLIYSIYTFDLSTIETNGANIYSLKLRSDIRDESIKYDLEILPNPRNHIRIGVISTYHQFTPQAVAEKGPATDLSNTKKYYALESALYLEDNFELNTKLTFNGGVRLSSYIINKHYDFHPEPRFSMRYMIMNDLSFKLGYSEMNQYLHLLSNTGVGLPTDLWVPSTERIKPESSRQISGGFFKDAEWKKKAYVFSLEGYYKFSRNTISYKEGASFYSVVDPYTNTKTQKTFEDVVTSGDATSYGTEVFVQKKEGKFTGWIGYTLSWTSLQFDSLNGGKKFWARSDRRHDISVVGIYKINSHFTASAIWVYGTGNAVTLPYGSQITLAPQPPYTPRYSFPGAVYAYEGINTFRMAPYHRLDISLQYHKKLKRFDQIVEIDVYNVYNRANPYFYYVSGSGYPSKQTLKQVSLFPILPSVSYSIKF